MDGFKFWIISVCGATAITSIFRILLSGSSLKKVLNIFFSLFVLFYTVIPIGNFISDKEFRVDIENDEISYNEFYEDGYRMIVEQSIKKSCEKLSVKVLSISMKSYIDEEGYFNIEDLEIEIDSPDKSVQVKEQLKAQLGFEVNVI